MKSPHPLAILLALTVAASPLSSTAQAAPQKPNILFLFADDLTYEAVRAFGHTDIDTPNLDRLAARGTTFRRCYNMGSWSPAVCIASRAMLITGRHVWDAQSVHPKLNAERENGVLWPQLLAQAGYETYMTGKWHIPTDAARCFQTVGTVRQGMPKDSAQAYNRPLEGKPDLWRADDSDLGGYWTGGKHWSEVTAEEAIGFIKQDNRSRKPFFMYVAFNAPHDPRQSPREFLDRYPLERIALPRAYQADYPHKDDIGCGPSLRDEKLAPFPRTEHAVKVHRREYYALITHLDTQIGRILDTLETSGLAENTLIFFTADHGLAVGNHGLMGKQNMYDHSVRVPFIVSGPNVPKGQTRDAAIYLQDVMPTTLALAGAKKPAHVFFNDLHPLIADEKQPSLYPAVYGSYLQLQRSVTHNGWKLIHYPKTGANRLYHLETDPLEKSDLANEPAQTERISMLKEKLSNLQTTLHDKLNAPPAN
jgi:choline-sulfatase